MRLGAAVVLIAAAACNSGTLDSGSAPNVVLEVVTITPTPITASFDQVRNICTFTVTNWTVTFNNQPKNSLGLVRPYNDINLEGVTIHYKWDDEAAPGGTITPDTNFAVGGTILANGVGTAQFTPIGLGNLQGRDGLTASLTMVFRGRTVEGDAVTATSGGVLAVNSCF